MNIKYREFLHTAKLLNRELNILPLLFGSLGLEIRLNMSLNADDIDILVHEKYITCDFDKLLRLMTDDNYTLCNTEEHEFEKSGICVAYTSIESLTPFAGIDTAKIPVVTDNGADYLLLELTDYLKVYKASSKDGYRKNIRHKKDREKIEIITRAICSGCE